ncbi:thioredoxin family protein [Mycoplasmopsis lipofaciens]|uniref:thioredoxin family protein n=1 Tax=Mycoplasmopsis lipofaciens TaxID=114884 RepID=UPI0004803E17|nr:thioredoxin family protein [Mycoplasmopsis lipofaciens]
MIKMLWNDAQSMFNNKKYKDKIFFIEFTTEWCGDCKMMAPIIQNVVKHYENSNEIIFIEVDAEEAKLFRNPLSEYKVLFVPTHLIVKNGKIIKTGYNYYPKEILIDWIEEVTN